MSGASLITIGKKKARSRPRAKWRCQDVIYLMSDWTNIFERKRLELVLLEKVVEVLLEHLEHEAGVVLVREALVSPHKVKLVRILLTEKKEFQYNY